MQNPGSPGDERRAMPAVEPLAPRLDPDQLHVLVVQERVEGPDRIGASADACDHPGGKAPLGRLRLLARLVADHPL